MTLNGLRYAFHLIAAVLVLALPATAVSQTSTGTLFIEAKDESGAVLPGVVVMITNQDNGVGRRGTTSPLGTLVVPLLPAGSVHARRRARRVQDRGRA